MACAILCVRVCVCVCVCTPKLGLFTDAVSNVHMQLVELTHGLAC